MKIKKFIGVFVSVCMLMMLGGCYEPLDITESEMDMVAEYAAGVLIKHGTQATDVLLDREEQETAFAAMATPTPRPTLAPAQKEDNVPSEDGEDLIPEATKKPVATEVPDNTILTMQDLTDLMGKKDFFFSYKGYKATTLYQGSGDLFAASGEGKQLVVVEFDVTNQSDTGATLGMNKGASKEFVYTLRAGGKTIRPSLTLLNEDLYTSYNSTFEAGETKTGVLVFECDKKMSLANMILTILKAVEGQEDSVLIKIK